MGSAVTTLFYLTLAMMSGVGIAVLWRTCIYIRGGIFRPIGRILDYWCYKASLPESGPGYKILRFFAYPLGRCIYCSHFHFSYDMFFLVSFFFDQCFPLYYLIFYLPISHLLLIATVRWLLEYNKDLEMNDWEYMKNNPSKFIDFKTRNITWK
jgi:hypothetical protein